MSKKCARQGRIANLPTQQHIAGKSIATPNSDKIDIFDPGRGEVFAQTCSAGEEEVEQAVAAARNAFRNTWGQSSPAERANTLFQAANLLEQEAARFAVVECLDAGKTLAQAQGDIAASIATLRFYAGAADKMSGKTIPIGKNYLAFTLCEPVGVSLHITPWNYPLVTLLRGVAPALAAGCCVVCKPAEQTPLTALMLADLLARAKPTPTERATSSSAQAKAQEQGSRNTKTSTISPSQDRSKRASASYTLPPIASPTPPWNWEENLPSSCWQTATKKPRWKARSMPSSNTQDRSARQARGSSSKRASTRHFSNDSPSAQKKLSFGHGLRNPDIGAIATREQRDKIERYITQAQSRGITPRTGGKPATDPETQKGWFFEPTIIDNLKAQDPLVQEEIFGPVLAVQVAEDAEDAFALADDTRYGLYAGIYTQNIDRALCLARDLQVGQVTINEYFAGGLALPFGGNRLSGFGREKGLEGLANYCSIKSVAAKNRLTKNILTKKISAFIVVSVLNVATALLDSKSKREGGSDAYITLRKNMAEKSVSLKTRRDSDSPRRQES